MVLALALLATLTGCGQRQEVATATEGQKIEDIPNDSGGYAKDLADPPAERAVVDVESNIQAGSQTNSQDPTREPEAENHEAEKAAAAEAVQKASAPDKSGDQRWAAVSKPVVAIQTSKGVFYLELWPDVAPKHSANLLKLVKSKFYDGIFVHRVEPGFVVQMGDPVTKQIGPQGPGVGSGGPGWTVPAEFSQKPHVKGTLSMARSGDPNSGGSQFFVCLGRAEHLDGQYSVFGQVLGDGMDVVDKLLVGDQMQFAWVVHE